MCGICLTVDTNRQEAINELLRNDLQNLDGLKLITETSLGEKLISTDSYEIIKRAISDKQPELIHMMNKDNRDRLFELALIKKNMWDNRTELKVYIKPHSFDSNLNAFIEKYANEWTPYCGIKFSFVNSLPAEIIIELNANFMHSSQIGKNALPISNTGGTTMNLGLGTATNIEQIRRPILHEFGHALGCIHEHQSPVAAIQWNEPAVLRTHALGGWDEATVRHNIFGKYSQSEITNSEFDKDSIMLYPISSDLTLDGTSFAWNTQLSDKDKAFMKKAYSIV
jgi:hypothetical protein